MENKQRKSAVKGRIAQVDICPSEAGFVLSVGPVSLWLEPGVAEDIVETLAHALSLEASRPTVQSSELAVSSAPAAADARRKSN
jgi:hypothetical protein